MNKLILSLCSSIVLFHCSALPVKDNKQSPDQKTIKIEPSGQPVHVYVNITNDNEPNFNNDFEPSTTINNDGKNITEIKNKSTATNINKIEIGIKQVIQQVMEFSPRNMASSTHAWLKLHKIKIIAGSVGATYLAICSLLITGNRFVNKRTTWASWKRSLSLEELQESSQDKLGKDLIHDIQKRHTNATNPTDHITPLVQFIKAVEKEMRFLNRYLMLAKTLKFCRLTRIFPTNERKIERAIEARRRLTFVKHTFISWTATDNLANFNHAAPAA